MEYKTHEPVLDHDVQDVIDAYKEKLRDQSS